MTEDLEKKTEEYNFEKNSYNPNHIQRNMIIYDKLYRKGLHPQTRLKNFVKSNLAMLGFVVKSSRDGFAVKDVLAEVHKDVKKKFDNKGLDETMKKAGDPGSPFQRLENIVDIVFSKEEYDSLFFFYGFVKDYYNKYFSYLAAYEKYKSK